MPHRRLCLTDWPQAFTLPDGRRLCLRRLEGRDLEPLRATYARQDAASLRARFHCASHGAAAARLLALLQAEPQRQLALVLAHADGGAERLVAEAGWVRSLDGHSAEFALIVDRAWQHQGLGQVLLRALVGHAQRERLSRLHGLTQADNGAMQALARACGFAVLPHRISELATLEMALDATPPAAGSALPGGAAQAAGGPPGWWRVLAWLARPA